MTFKELQKARSESGVVNLDLPAIRKLIQTEMSSFRPTGFDLPVRFSSGPQKDGTSEARQVGNIQMICEEIEKIYGGKELPKRWLKELAEDGKTMKHLSAFAYVDGVAPILDERTVLGKYIKAAGAGDVPAGTLIVVDAARAWSRAKPGDAMEAVTTCLKKGIHFLVLKPPFYVCPDDRHSQKKMNEFFGLLAGSHEYSKQIQDNVKDSIKLRIEYAKAGGKVSFGGAVPRWVRWDVLRDDYILHDSKYENSSKGEKLNVVKSYEAVRLIIDGVVANRPIARIVQRHHESKFKPLNGGKCWSDSALRAIIGNVALVGTLIINGETIPNIFPQVCTDREFAILEARLNTKLYRGGGVQAGSRNITLFPGRVFCVHCRRAMGFSSSYKTRFSKRQNRDWVCRSYSTKVNADGCPICKQRRGIRIAAVEQDFFGYVLKELPSILTKRMAGVTDRRVQEAKLNNDIAAAVAATKSFQDTCMSDLNADEEQKARNRIEFARYQQKERDAKAALKSFVTGAKGGVNPGLANAWKAMAHYFTGEDLDICDPHIFEKAAVSAEQLIDEVEDKAGRKELVDILKMLVRRIDVNVNREGTEVWRKYTATFIDGTNSGERDVTKLQEEMTSLNISEAQLGRSEAERAATTAKRRATMAAKSPEAIAAMRAKLSKALTGFKRSKATRALMRAAAKALWAAKREV
jgi:hypothetical protein